MIKKSGEFHGLGAAVGGFSLALGMEQTYSPVDIVRNRRYDADEMGCYVKRIHPPV